MVFDTSDDDKYKRSYTPVTLHNLEKDQNSVLNQFMDHIWDGFYTGQLRLNRFPTLIETGYNYKLLFTGTVPSNQRFLLHAETGGSVIQIHYLKTGAFKVTDTKGNVIAGNSYDDKTK
mmetsp:Transcript_21729/g.16039  ORF Transcript_21729/g.16039 Transcript_21729/m.16039 type:complete len:118 (+) Transcript_21729:509-862(+)